MQKRAVIVHGWDGNPHDAWKSWLKLELEKRGFKVIAPQFPGGNFPQLKEWLQTLSTAVGAPDENTYFIGHSLGCITIMKYIQSLPPNTKVGGCVFVAGFSGGIGVQELSNFYAEKVDFAKIKIHSSKFVVIHGSEDDDVPMKNAKDIERGLNAKLIIEQGRGHMAEDEGVHELPSALGAILEMSA